MSKSKLDELRSEYNREELGDGIRGKFFKGFNSGTNIVLLDPDVAENFDSEKSVNEALRALIKISHKTLRKSNHPPKEKK